MTKQTRKKHSWLAALHGYKNPRIAIFLLLGFSCGLPFGLIGYSLSLWLTDVGLGLFVISSFALIKSPYSFKFLFAPLIDRIRLPFLANQLGQKKAWLLFFQCGLILSIFGLASTSPDKNSWIWEWPWTITNKAGSAVDVLVPAQTYLYALLTAYFSAGQDIVVDALRINTLSKEEYGEGAGMYQFGYRMGMLISGAGVCWLAGIVSWQMAYACVGFILISGFIGTFLVREPQAEWTKQAVNTARLIQEMVVNPFRDFMHHMDWFWILIFIFLYKICNSVLGSMAMPFYRDMGFSNEQIALISGLIGPWITIGGVVVGGILVMRYNILKLLMVLGIIEILTSIVFGLFSLFPESMFAFMIVILFDNIVGGAGGAVFVAFLSGLCSQKYAATQYALLTSLTMLALSFVSFFSGIWAEKLGWMYFFFLTGILMLPALFLLQWLMIRLRYASEKHPA